MIFTIIPRAQVSANRINEVLETNSTVVDGTFDGNTKTKGTVEFVNVSFKSLTTTINYIGAIPFNFSNIQSGHITINYTSVCEASLDAYLAAHPDYNWVKGKLITAPSSN